MVQLEIEKSNSKEYEVETIYNNKIYTRKLESYLPGLYYLVFWKRYPKEKNIWEPTLAIQDL